MRSRFRGCDLGIAPGIARRGHFFNWGVLSATSFILSLLLAGCASVSTVSDAKVDLDIPLELPPAPTAPEPAPPADDPPAFGKGKAKSYLVPAADILGFDFLLNQYDRHFIDEDTYDSNWSSFEKNLHKGWVIDNDPFAVNQFGHPYQGSMYHGFSRSAGLNYWQALGYDFLGSALWETAGETGPPSFNDQITTSFGGSFLGEALFRMASRVLDRGGRKPGGGRELGAAIISPATGFNRLAFGKRFDPRFPDRDPAVFTTTSLGARRNAKVTDLGVLGDIQKDGAIASFTMDYGLPGKPGYGYSRPFDYFHFEASTTSSLNAFPESIVSRGLLAGSDYKSGDSYRGVWGLYGSYDYMSPEVFSISSTALGLGTTGQWNISDSVALQGTCMGGVGWAAVGALADARTDRNYHAGVSPQALLSLRFLFGDSVMLDMSGQEYYVEGGASDNGTGSESIFRGMAALTVRVLGHHAIGLQFVNTTRDANFSQVNDSFQSVGALSVVYTYLNDEKLGVVKW
ncbi:MAG TPA: DUF3943 domain-containing protein [Planctomycetota bacterium]|nr:DUF3943 domain-containing protein [Planctomycetota bacterium]